jgi:hypothetical protein
MALNDFGSLVNTLWVSAATPVVGMPATVLAWTDRYGATVTWVSPSGKTCRVRECIARRIDKNGMSEAQEYEYSENLAAPEREFRLGKRGWREAGRGNGNGLSLGHRSEYHDYSF